jgi:hypothetical protein
MIFAARDSRGYFNSLLGTYTAVSTLDDLTAVLSRHMLDVHVKVIKSQVSALG